MTPRAVRMSGVCCGRAVDDEPRIDGDAVAADAGAGREDVDPRVAVGEADHLPHVEVHRIGDDRQLVGEGDVDVAVGVLDQLGHFRRAGVGGDAGPAHEALVEGQRLARATRGDPADRAIVVGQLFENAAGQHALGAIGDGHVGRAVDEAGQCEVAAFGGDRVAQLLGGADRRGRFEDHRVARLEHFRHARRGGEDIGHIGGVLAILVERGRHGDDEHLGRLDLGAGAQQAALDDALHQPVEIDFLDVNFAAVDRVDHRLADVDAVHRHPRPGDHRRRWKSDIAESDNADPGKVLAAHECPFRP